MALHMEVIPNGQKEMFYSSSPAEERCIGHVRIDFGSGDEFHSTWCPHSAAYLNTCDFRASLNSVVNTLRNNLLGSCSMMRKYLAEHPAPELENNSYGYRIENDCFEYFIRCTPMRSNYNCYIYCYAKKSRTYSVTVCRYGCVKVEAESPDAAMSIANRMAKTDEVNWDDDWACVDAQPVDEL